MTEDFDIFDCPVKVIDVGARVGVEPSYHSMTQLTTCEVVAVDADPDAELPDYAVQAQLFAGDGSEQEFKHTASGFMSSFFEPDMRRLRHLSNLAELSQVVRREKVQTVPLDECDACHGASFITIDVQGAELMVLNGCDDLLNDSVDVVELEVNWVPIYEGQPRTADVFRFFNERGFVFLGLGPQNGHMVQPMTTLGGNRVHCGQLVDGDVAFVRDWLTWESLPDDRLLKLATVLNFCFSSFDLCVKALQILDRRNGTDLVPRYLKALNSRA